MATRKSFREIPCSIARSLEEIGEWWTPLVLRDIFYGLRRFEEIATDLPIARNVLAARLKGLVASGLLEKHQYATSPARYEYHLTEKGQDAFGVLLALMAWGDRWANPDDRPPVVVRCRSCNTETTAEICCSACKEELTPWTVGVRPMLGQETPRPHLALRRR